jgi:hypothetical protein
MQVRILPGAFGELMMPSTDIDGSVIVILSAAEAKRVYDHLYEIAVIAGAEHLTRTDHTIIDKIARDLKLPPLE